jgi:hypothetical protein
MPERTRRSKRAWAAAWALLPARAFAISSGFTLLVWGRFLLPNVTVSPEAQAQTIHPLCRVGTAQLVCQTPYGQGPMMDPGAPAWQESPADYFFRRARMRGEPRPSWNPYAGSGYPIALDGHNAATSPTRWFLSHFPGDGGRDALIFTRLLLWTFGTVWAVGLCGGGAALLLGVAAAAALAPYPAMYVDHVFLDVDLLAPWFLVLLLAFAMKAISLRIAIGLSLVGGAVVSAMGFQQAQVVFSAVVGFLVLAAAPATRGRSLLLGVAIAAGQVLLFPAWLPMVRNLDQFVTSRDVLCIIEQSQGSALFWNALIHPLFTNLWFATATLVGAGLLVFTPRRWLFVAVVLAAMGAWIVLGLPHAACSVPLFSGVRFWRHLLPHFQMLFIFAVGVAIQRLSEGLDRKWIWPVFVAACAVSLAIAIDAQPVNMRARVLGCSLGGAALGIFAAAVRTAPGVWAIARRGAFAGGLVLFAFPPYLLGSHLSAMILRGKAGSTQVAPLPAQLDPSTPLGAVQALSEREDRRHVSPSGFLYSNWSEAVGILDVLSIGAFYPKGYHELNATLFQQWDRDPGHGINPDRFVPPPTGKAMTPEFQRVMAAHRVSLLTFLPGQVSFAAAPSPYEETKCRMLARSDQAPAESYVCPEVGGIGYFPEVVRTVRSRAEALELLKSSSPSEIVRLALLGPELDLSGPGEAVVPESGAGRVLSVQRRSDELIYELDVERPGMFAVADTYFRGWHATVNGRAAGISRSNVAFKAVHVPAGKVELKLHFTLK